MDISANIKAIRSTKGISQAELSRRLDLDPSAYFRLENRGEKLSIQQAQSIADALGVTLVELIMWGEERAERSQVAQTKEIENLQNRESKILSELHRAYRIVDFFLSILPSDASAQERLQEIRKSIETSIGVPDKDL